MQRLSNAAAGRRSCRDCTWATRLCCGRCARGGGPPRPGISPVCAQRPSTAATWLNDFRSSAPWTCPSAPTMSSLQTSGSLNPKPQTPPASAAWLLLTSRASQTSPVLPKPPKRPSGPLQSLMHAHAADQQPLMPRTQAVEVMLRSRSEVPWDVIHLAKDHHCR